MNVRKARIDTIITNVKEEELIKLIMKHALKNPEEANLKEYLRNWLEEINDETFTDFCIEEGFTVPKLRESKDSRESRDSLERLENGVEISLCIIL